MRFIFTLAAAALVACSVESTTTKPATDNTPTDPGPTDDGSSGGGSTSSSGGSSSGGSSSGGSSSGKTGSSSGGSSSGSTSTTCTTPSISTSKTLGALTSTEKGELCDYSACPFGGYGKSKSCSNGTTVKSKSSQSTCTSDPTWSKCASLSVGDFLACNDKINADPCNALTILTSDSDCASFKQCAFGQ